MDPISAAGIGLSVTSLVLQVFSGCVTAYQLFADAQDMPAAYRFLRVRLLLEQSRLLRWGEKIGLAEELLDKPSRTLQLNRNLIFDMLLEIQALFKKTVKIQDKFDVLVPGQQNTLLPIESGTSQPATQSSKDRLLQKALRVFNKLPEAPKCLQWAMIEQDKFKALVEQLIGYNDAIEGLLEVGAIEQLLDIQRQTYMNVLQLNSKVDDLKQISLAMQIHTIHPPSATPPNASTDELSITRQRESEDLAELASFKAQQSLSETELSTIDSPHGRTGLDFFKSRQSLLETGISEIEPLHREEVILKGDADLDLPRCEGIYKNQQIWIEWKIYDASNDRYAKMAKIVSLRVKGIVSLLQSPQKSSHFRAPDCLGYFTIQDDPGKITRYGFVYSKPQGIPRSTPATSLYSQFLEQARPSLTQRIALAYTVARSLMYLHSVNWLHKGFRSNNIVFFIPPTIPPSKPSYTSPIISGFEYSRLDLSGEATEPVREHTENSIYRHPFARSGVMRSNKSHDIYSLGLVLIEIAYWKRIHDIVHLPSDEREARRMVRRMRGMLLEEERSGELGSLVGDSYAKAVEACIEGLVGKDEDEEHPEVGARIQEAFHDRVVARLGAVVI